MASVLCRKIRFSVPRSSRIFSNRNLPAGVFRNGPLAAGWSRGSDLKFKEPRGRARARAWHQGTHPIWWPRHRRRRGGWRTPPRRRAYSSRSIARRVSRWDSRHLRKRVHHRKGRCAAAQPSHAVVSPSFSPLPFRHVCFTLSLALFRPRSFEEREWEKEEERERGTTRGTHFARKIYIC